MRLVTALQSSALDANPRVKETPLDLHEVDPELRAGVAADAVTVSRQRWEREHRRPPALSLREAVTAARFETLFVWICAGNLRNGVALADADFDRLTLACNRIESIFSEVLQ